jgi:atypical dual specificity phosphatase
MMEPIADNIWWVIPHKLAGMRMPIEAEIAVLKSLGISAIASVMDDPTNLELYRDTGVAYLWLPTRGGTAPTVQQVDSFQEFVDDQNSLGHAVAVHCTSGRRRTGTMLAAYLIKAGFSYDEAIHTIYRTNPTVELRDAQTAFLHNLGLG